MQTIEATWGERLVLELGRWERATGRTKTALFEAVGNSADVTTNTIGNLRNLDEPPTGKRARYGWLLLTAMGLEPDDFGLAPTWPDHVNRQRQIRTIRERLDHPRVPGGSSSGSSSKWAARDSNPEPAGSLLDEAA